MKLQTQPPKEESGQVTLTTTAPPRWDKGGTMEGGRPGNHEVAKPDWLLINSGEQNTNKDVTY